MEFASFSVTIKSGLNSSFGLQPSTLKSRKISSTGPDYSQQPQLANLELTKRRIANQHLTRITCTEQHK
jgi:hypothetical protein